MQFSLEFSCKSFVVTKIVCELSLSLCFSGLQDLQHLDGGPHQAGDAEGSGRGSEVQRPTLSVQAEWRNPPEWPQGAGGSLLLGVVNLFCSGFVLVSLKLIDTCGISGRCATPSWSTELVAKVPSVPLTATAASREMLSSQFSATKVCYYIMLHTAWGGGGQK